MESGQITVIMGPMYSGKSTRLLEQVRRSDLGHKRFILIKPATDDRYSSHHVVSHDNMSFPCSVVDSNETIIPHIPENTSVVFIDEVQFFNSNILNDIEDLALRGVDVVVAGLDLDFMGNPFKATVDLAFTADHVIKLSAICDVCGCDAIRSQRIVDGAAVTSGKVVEVGGLESYEARCRSCFVCKDVKLSSTLIDKEDKKCVH